MFTKYEDSFAANDQDHEHIKADPRKAAEDLWRHLTTSGDDLSLIDVSGSGVNFTKGLVLTDLPDNVIAPYLVNDLDTVVNQVARVQVCGVVLVQASR